MFDRTKQDRLKVYISPDFIDEIDNLPEIIVYTDKLEMVKSSSNKTVNIVDPARVLKFNARLIGNGRLNVTGLDTDRAVGEIVTGNGVLSLQGRGNDTLLKLTGTGTIQAHDLDAEKVTCHVFGSGDIYCYPQDTLVLKGLGSTRVHYRGLPKTIKKSGFGKLLPME